MQLFDITLASKNKQAGFTANLRDVSKCSQFLTPTLNHRHHGVSFRYAHEPSTPVPWMHAFTGHILTLTLAPTGLAPLWSYVLHFIFSHTNQTGMVLLPFSFPRWGDGLRRKNKKKERKTCIIANSQERVDDRHEVWG